MEIHRYMGDPEEKGWALGTIKDGLLKVSRLSEFNDPFEGMFSMPETISAAQMRQYVRAGREDPRVAFSPTLAEIKCSESEMTRGIKQRYPEIRRQRLVDLDRARDDLFLAASFSDTSQIDPTNEILLWSHYANSHRGVRLGFEINDRDARSYKLENVVYDSKRITIELAGDPDKNAKLLLKAYMRKSEAWSYEKELRLFLRLDRCESKIVAGKSLYFFRYPQAWISSVDFGAECPSNIKEPIIDFVRSSQRPIKLRQASYHESEFALVYDEIII
ncbi:DUF2971 domain-containing protein [Prosthecobacter sp.]|jgi:hypothetical protein|uniref:DUF2971 domain-containing protein n=1 Tax=Prosthecobacter sp. TaxID=1965333 RepID=UPI0037C8B12B